jgi:RNA polymerase sigma-70 factor, ECF subfamily
MSNTLALDEPQLIARLRAGEETAFEQLVRSTSGRLLAAARRLLRNEEDARDAVQSAFIRAFQSLSRFREESRLSTWLHRILVNEALMRLRSRARGEEESIDGLLPTFVADGHQTRDTVDWSETADKALERAETAALINRAIDQLPESYRTVLVMRDLEELSSAEVAEMLGVSTNVIKVRLHRARQALRTLLEREFGGTK